MAIMRMTVMKAQLVMKSSRAVEAMTIYLAKVELIKSMGDQVMMNY